MLLSQPVLFFALARSRLAVLLLPQFLALAPRVLVLLVLWHLVAVQVVLVLVLELGVANALALALLGIA